MQEMYKHILAVYRSNPQASRLEVLHALDLAKPTTLFDDQLVKVQDRLRGDIPNRTFTKGASKVEEYGACVIAYRVVNLYERSLL